MRKQDKVKQRIQISKERRSTQLDISNLGVTEFPQEILALTHLESLYLGGNQIESLPQEITQLTNLNRLSLSGNSFELFPMPVLQISR
ncbi:leucine-rich repeat domain-containing protein, partial [Chloroflexota bacterium]